MGTQLLTGTPGTPQSLCFSSDESLECFSGPKIPSELQNHSSLSRFTIWDQRYPKNCSREFKVYTYPPVDDTSADMPQSWTNSHNGLASMNQPSIARDFAELLKKARMRHPAHGHPTTSSAPRSIPEASVVLLM